MYPWEIAGESSNGQRIVHFMDTAGARGPLCGNDARRVRIQPVAGLCGPRAMGLQSGVSAVGLIRR
jgi:hypothetical protein